MVKFDHTCDWTEAACVSHSGGPYIRRDAPCGAVPAVVEPHRLRKIEVKRVEGGFVYPIRSYTLNHSVTPTDGSCPANGSLILNSVDIYGKTPLNLNRTIGFWYSDGSFQKGSNPAITRPFLTQVQNGYGGTLSYEYASIGGDVNDPNDSPMSEWTRVVVTKERRGFGFSRTASAAQPDIVRSFTYDAGPKKRPRSSCTWVPCAEEYRGFGAVNEYLYDTADATGDWIEHQYYANSGTSQLEDKMSGREKENWLRDSAGTVWGHNKYTWNYWVTNGYDAQLCDYQIGSSYEALCAYFPFLQQEDRYLKDGTNLRKQYSHDAYGNLTGIWDYGDVSGLGDETNRMWGYLANTTAWIFVPNVEAWDNLSGSQRATYFYYDGSQSALSNAGVPAGRLTATKTVLNATEQSSVYYVYDVYGNVLQRSAPTLTTPESWAGLRPAEGWIPDGVPKDIFEYGDPYHALATKHWNALNHLTQTDYDLDFQLAKKVTYPNGQEVYSEYDDFGRLKKSWDLNSSAAIPLVQYDYVRGGFQQAPFRVTVTQLVDQSPYVEMRQTSFCLDGFLREYDQRMQKQGGVVEVRTDYDARGRTLRVSNPLVAAYNDIGCLLDYQHLPTANADHQAFEYDPLNNVTREIYRAVPGGLESSSSASFSGKTSEFIDENGHRTRQVRDLVARTLTVEEWEGVGTALDPWSLYASTVYQHDRFGQPTTVTDALGNQTVMQYDTAGRKISMSDPDMGAWTYAYDVAGNLVEQVDAKGQHRSLAYDELSRLLNRSNDSGWEYFVYDTYASSDGCADPTSAKGQLVRTAMNFPFKHVRSSCYDKRGQEIKGRTLINNIPYVTQRSYNDLGAMETLTYPDGEVLTYTYSGGQLAGMTSNTGGNLISSVTTKPWGGLASVGLSALSKTTTYGYDYRMRVTSIVTGTAAPTYLQNLTLTYDLAGNVKTVTDTADGGSELVSYNYDDLDRLTSMTIDNAPTPSAAYAYNQIGNLIAKQEGSSSLTLLYTPSLACTGGARNGPHAASSVSGTQTFAIAYDCNGNLKTVNGQAYTFDEANRLKERPLAGGQRERYTYAATGDLVKAENTVTGAYTHYVDGIYEKTDTGAVTKHYVALGREVAGRGADGALYYVLSDHLGTSTRVVAADGGATTYAAKYWPYGGTRWSTGASPTELLFTGQREEAGDAAAMGLYNYGARFYSTVMGRFVSVDPVVGSAGDPQSWNGYSYALNNPLRYVDPLGLTPDEDWVNSGSIGIERDTGCNWDCQQLQALAEVGWSYEQWQAWEHQQLVEALQLIANTVIWCAARPNDCVDLGDPDNPADDCALNPASCERDNDYCSAHPGDCVAGSPSGVRCALEGPDGGCVVPYPNDPYYESGFNLRPTATPGPPSILGQIISVIVVNLLDELICRGGHTGLCMFLLPEGINERTPQPN